MNNPLFLFSRLLCQIIIRPFIRVAALPQPPPLAVDKPCLIILGKIYASDELAVNTCLKQLELQQREILFLPAAGRERANEQFVQALRDARRKEPELQVVPASVFWGRSPRKLKSISQAYLSDSWAVPGMIRRRMMVLLQMRQVACYFGQAVDVEAFLESSDEPGLHDRIHHSLAEQFLRQKEAVIGPDLSHRRMLGQQVLHSSNVRDCIAQIASENEEPPKKLEKKAQKYLHEMAADYSYNVIRLFETFLSWLWEKLYQGVEIEGMENVQDVAEDRQLIYVPCHRSHIDYLLLSYVIFRKGLMPPHIAAGINLNLPVLGTFLRRAGAFFIRREFRDNRLYKEVLQSYVATMCQQGFPLEYFIEGGRSRTGFLLPHKAGMLAMTMRAAQDQDSRPLAFIPVYIGYERLLESHSYINELYGEKKQKESLFDLFSARRYLKENYGKVYVSMGKAISSDDIWQSMDINTRPRPTEGEEFFECVYRLGQTIQTQINSNASLSLLNLLATALLGSRRKALVKDQLIVQLDLLKRLTQAPIYQQSLHVEDASYEKAIERALSLNLMKRNQHTLGDIYFLNQQGQVSATFLRNNSLHVFILPALVATILVNTEKASFKLILAVCYRFYPYLKAEFFLPWELGELRGLVEFILSTLVDAGLVNKGFNGYRPLKPEAEQFHALMILSGACKGTVERFYITAQLVSSQDAHYYDKQSLEEACVQMAEGLSLLHEFHAPDFFDKNLFRTFISSLIREGMFLEDDDGKIEYTKAFLKAKKLDHYVLSPSVRRSIRHITHSDTENSGPREGTTTG